MIKYICDKCRKTIYEGFPIEVVITYKEKKREEHSATWNGHLCYDCANNVFHLKDVDF